jgi:putative transcriptional regulator
MKKLDKLFEFKPSGIKATKGRVLISEPLLGDFFFKRAVLLLAEHNDDGAFGLILNKKTDYKIYDLVEELEGFEADVFIGGPVETDNVFFLHTRNDLISGSEEIIDGVFWGGNFAEVKSSILSGAIKEDEIRFFLGYSGWSPNQLDEELKQYSWLVSKITPTSIFTKSPDELWKGLVVNFGEKFKTWLNIPINPQLN